MKTAALRKAFLDYFSKHGHQEVPSATLVPAHDPSLLFTNAGMVPFKDIFLGLQPAPYSCAVSVQRCVRAGGKHNDLENVGYTARHHTFFEMMGNFSFGAYFKREAIRYAWEFLTLVLKLPAEKLWVTVHLDDDEAADIWLKELKVSPLRFSRCDEDNFWSMGDTGPCGPCTEIFYDHGEDIPGGPPGSPEAEGDRYIEIWNLVFMQFNRDKAGKMHPLPRPCVDTGMGLERIAAVVQHVHTNYEIDSFQYLIKAILALAPPETNSQHPSLNVIADHLRASAFLIADGVIPGNEGRSYVLRRIIRRALRHGNKLGLPSPFFYSLVTALIKVMGDAYPHLEASKALIERLLIQEENQFAKTLDQGLRILQDEMKGLKTNQLSGELAFKLYDTYGFPLDLTEDIAREHQLQVDVAGFNECMQQQRELSQSASTFGVDYTLEAKISEISHFHGYDEDSMSSKVSAILVDGKRTETLNAGRAASVILTDTPFYAQSGGQVGDKGELRTAEAIFKVEDTEKVGQAIVHHGSLVKGSLHQGEAIEASIDANRRADIRRNHTATHLLHAALQQILGSHVQQKGSLVDAERARFDFSHFEPLSKAQLQSIETLVNDEIRANTEVMTRHMSLDEAKKSGAMALFGEKYEDKVRVLSIGHFSKELCGGTHVRRTGDIGLFKIVSEYGVASGVRRLEWFSGAHALRWLNGEIEVLDALSQKLKSTSDKALPKLSQLLERLRQQDKEITRLQAEVAQQSGKDYHDEAEILPSGVNLLIKQLPSGNAQTLRNSLDDLKSRMENAVIILYSLEGDKISVVAGVSKQLIGRVPQAAVFVSSLCGKGGGRPDMAQGGGVAPADLAQKIAEIRAMLAGT